MNRRRATRYEVDLPCRVSVPGGPDRPARVRDISQGGASIDNAPLLSPGERGTIRLEGVGFALPFAVVSSAGDRLRVTFELDDATVPRFRPFLDSLASSRAA
jgi:hypothetical protein